MFVTPGYLGRARMGIWEINASPGRFHVVISVIPELIMNPLLGLNLYPVYDSE